MECKHEGEPVIHEDVKGQFSYTAECRDCGRRGPASWSQQQAINALRTGVLPARYKLPARKA